MANDREVLHSEERPEVADSSCTDLIHSCSFCNVQELDPTLIRKETILGVGVLNWGTAIRYRGSRVLNGASNGCAFFEDAFGSLKTILSKYECQQGSGVPSFRPENWTYELFFHEWSGHLESATGNWSCAEGELQGHKQQPKQTASCYIVLSCQDNPAADSIPIRPFLHDSRGEGSALWAKQRLEECEAKHQSCRSVSPSFLPTRLLRIDTSNEWAGLFVRLHLMASEFHTVPMKYATLSYCWGGPQEFQLDACSEVILKGGIPVSFLPQTLHDAVQVTWNLGIRWIWIDSLCIRQHRPEDKVTEAAQMHLIYANSFITISATRASDCRQGFLHQCSLPAPSTTGYELPFASPCGRLGSVILYKGAMVPPIEFRGWTLQEHLLARRVLRFTDYQLHWSCGAVSMYENENPGALPSVYAYHLNRAYKMYRGIRADDRNCRNWMNIVEQYANRRLTDGLDKLPAISGIAQTWARTSSDHYLAGLWTSHLPLALLWTSAQPYLQNETQAYRAPSWSWAALDGQVDWFDHLFTQADPLLEVISFAINPVHPQAPYGAVQAGFLFMQGLVQQATFNDFSHLPAPANEDDEYLDLDLANVSLDFEDELLASKIVGAMVFSLQICCFDESTDSGPSGLVLATKDGKDFFRIGHFAFEPPQDYDVEELGSFNALLELSEARKLVQRSAFQGLVPRRVMIV